MLSQWLERARAGEPVWLPDMRAQCAQLPDPIDVTMQLTLCDGTQRDFPLPLPRWESDDQRQFVLDNNLTERHARAVLRLPENRRSEALINIAKRRLNARQTDLYIEQLLNSTAKGRHRISMVRDVRIFVNTIDHAIRLMTDNGVPATAHREEKDGYIEYTVRIPTAAAEK